MLEASFDWEDLKIRMLMMYIELTKKKKILLKQFHM